MLSIPQYLVSGGYYADIVLMPSDETEASDISIIGELSVPLLLEITNDRPVERSASIETFISTPSFLTTASGKFKLDISNSSEVHIKPRGSIQLTNPQQSRLPKSFTVNDDFVTLLPGKHLKEELAWSVPGYNPLVPYIGNYTAELQIIDSKTSEILATQSLSLTVVPVFHVLFSILILFLARKLFRKMRQSSRE